MAGHRCNKHNTKDCMECADQRIAELEERVKELAAEMDNMEAQGHTQFGAIWLGGAWCIRSAGEPYEEKPLEGGKQDE